MLWYARQAGLQPPAEAGLLESGVWCMPMRTLKTPELLRSVCHGTAGARMPASSESLDCNAFCSARPFTDSFSWAEEQDMLVTSGSDEALLALAGKRTSDLYTQALARPRPTSTLRMQPASSR